MRRAYPDEAVRERLWSDWEESVRWARAGDGRIGTSEVRVTGVSGETHEMQFSGVVVGGEAFCLWVDLTARKRAEELLRDRQEQLMRVGRVSTLGQLAASLAHELEQPLAAILRNAETADLLLHKDRRIDRAELGAIMTDILADDRRAGAVLDRIRGMVRRQRLEPEALRVDALLQDAARLIRPAADRHRVVMEISGEPNMPDITGDAVLLQQALLNLLLNAVDAIGERKDGRITLRAGEVKPGTVEISVGDNGGGVPPSELVSLFEPFFTTKKEGLGMGLPLVQSIVEQHGGKLRVANQPGRGLVVSLQLPVWPDSSTR
jgi:C4-dicarboxylate-specific signal transduction histidine kinase